LDRASKIVPQNGAFLRELGILTLDANPRAAEQLLQRAVALNSFDADALIGLGLLAESGGSVEHAEEFLIRAVNVSRRFKPKWALAYFYARQRRMDSFWPIASAAANVEGGDPQPVFRLAHDVMKDPERVADLLQLNNQHALRSYLEFLLRQEGPTALGRVALRIEPNIDSRQLLLATVDQLINQNRIDEAVPLWNRLYASNGNRPLVPTSGASLTNGRFDVSEGRGFDWRHGENPGIDIRDWGPGDLRIEFSGHQPESVPLLEQYVPVVPNKSYRFSFAYRTTGMTGVTGLYWQVFEATAPLKPVPEGVGTLAFRTGPGVGLVRLALMYARAPGTMRLEGGVTLRSAELEVL
jgi:tetratricopeptide (TPR) repeat protein